MARRRQAPHNAPTTRSPPPALPEPRERTGEPDVDALLELREYVADLAQRVDQLESVTSRIDADAIGEASAAAVRDQVRTETREVVRELHQVRHGVRDAAEDAHQAAEESRQTAAEARSGMTPRRAAAIALCAAVGGHLAGLPAGVYLQLAYIEGILTRLDALAGAGVALAIAGVIALVWPRR